MNADEKNSSPSVPEKNAEKKMRLLWLFVAAGALVAAFFLQWRNSVEQAAIAQTDDGILVRAKIENGALRIFSGRKNEPIAEAFLYGNDGEMIAKIVPAPNEPERFVLADSDFSGEKLRAENYVRIVIPSEKSDGKPVILLVKNPFRETETRGQKQ